MMAKSLPHAQGFHSQASMKPSTHRGWRKSCTTFHTFKTRNYNGSAILRAKYPAYAEVDAKCMSEQNGGVPLGGHMAVVQDELCQNGNKVSSQIQLGSPLKEM